MSYTSSKGRSRKVLIDGGASVANTDPYGNSMVSPPGDDDSPQDYQTGQFQTAQQSSGSVIGYNTQKATTQTKESDEPITYGITKNVSIDYQRKSFLGKWFRSLFSGVPFSIDNEVTMFQVFPDFTGSSLNAMGNACDQVIVYGKLNRGAVSVNNDVEVYGHRDNNNNVIAKKIKNKASGTTIIPYRTISSSVVRVVSLLIFVSIFVIGILWG